MTISAGDNHPTEPAESNAVRDPSPETIEDTELLTASFVQGAEQDRSDRVPVFLLPNRSKFEQALLDYGIIEPESLREFLGPPSMKRSRRIPWDWPESWSGPES